MLAFRYLRIVQDLVLFFSLVSMLSVLALSVLMLVLRSLVFSESFGVLVVVSSVEVFIFVVRSACFCLMCSSDLIVVCSLVCELS